MACASEGKPFLTRREGACQEANGEAEGEDN